MTEVLIILFLFFLNGLFAMCEIALVSSRRSRLRQAEKNGSRGAKIALKLSDEPEKFLSTIQIGITLVGIIAGAYGGDAFADDVEPFVERFAWLAPYSEQVAFTAIIIVITYFSLIIGELVPKTIALNNPERLTIALAPFMKVLAAITYPLVWFLSLSTKVVLKLLMIKEKKHPEITEEELKYLIDTGSKYGIIEKQEGEMLHSVFKFADKKAAQIMIYRRNIKWLNVDQPADDILADIFELPYTKYPVADGSLDKIIGVVTVTDLLRHVRTPKFDIRQYLREPLFFAEHVPALRILEEFRQKKAHIGFVVSEYGSTVGLITLHDLLENIVGEFPETDQRRGDTILQRPDGSWFISGGLNMNEVRKALGMPADKQTGKFALETYLKRRLGKKAPLGIAFEEGGYRFEIVDINGTRIEKVLVTRTANP